MAKATLVFVSEQAGFRSLAGALDAYSIVHVTAPGSYMKTLIEAQAAMIVVDAAHPAWRRFTTAPKSSAATRRIPLLLFSDDADTRAEAIRAGADLALSWPDLQRDLQAIIAEYARLPDPRALEQLACQCEGELPDLAERGFQAFNQGRYYAQHDYFEALWMETAGPVRDLYRAILQVGVAYYHVQKGNRAGALKMLQRSVQWLAGLPDACQGIDVAGLRRDSYALRAQLEIADSDDLSGFDMSLLKPLRRLPADQPPAEST